MKWTTTFLRSKVARRVFLLFVSCALLPITVLAIMSFYQVSQQLQSESRGQLMGMSESQGMLIDERLQSLDGDLQLISWQSKGDRLPELSGPLQDHFKALAIFSEDGSRTAEWGGTLEAPNLAPDDRAYVQSGKPLVQTHACEEQPGNCVRLVRAMDIGQPTQRILVGEINPEYLWVRQHLPAGLEACVQTASGVELFCSDPALTLIKPQGRGHSSSGFFQWRNQNALYDAAYWSLLLRPGFHTESWLVMIGQNHDDIFMPMRRFRNSFPLVVLLALWVVTLVSSVQIRRTLVPLEKLQEGTRQIAQQHFDERVDVSSGDEFESLAESFNYMAMRLGRQFHALRTINEIDQAIFASLNREGIVDAVLDHMPFLLPCDCFAVAIFGDERTSGSVRFRDSRGRGTRRTIPAALLSAADAERLRENAVSLQIDGRQIPGFLQPLAEAGMESFLALPILVDGSLFAALVSANGSLLQLSTDDIQQTRQVADQLAVAFSNVQLIDAMEQLHWGTLTALARAIDAKSAWTAGHSERVTTLALRIGRAMGLSADDLRIMQRGGLLHDIGKIGTPPGILDKSGKLDTEETQVMQDHVKIGIRILEPIAAFREALPIVAQHHEWFDGSGYPNHLAGEEINLQARIFAVADVYDALTSDRPYRKGVPRQQTMQMIQEKSGTQFDPKVVEVFMRMSAEQQDVMPRAPSPRSVQSAAAGQGV